MSGWSARSLGVAAWVAVVAVGAVLVWVVISRAGGGLVADAGPVTVPSTGPAAGGGSPAVPSDAARRGRWQGESGVVTASCQGGAIALVGAQPEDGVVVRVKNRGPEQLLVTFDGDEEGLVTLVATCRNGRPQFTATAGTSADASTPSPSSTATSEGDDGSGADVDGPRHGSDDGSRGAPEDG